MREFREDVGHGKRQGLSVSDRALNRRAGRIGGQVLSLCEADTGRGSNNPRVEPGCSTDSTRLDRCSTDACVEQFSSHFQSLTIDSTYSTYKLLYRINVGAGAPYTRAGV